MFRFAHSEYLYGLLLLPVLILFFWYLMRNRKRLLEKFSNRELIARLAPERSPAKLILKNALVILTLGLLILAVANPQIGTKYEEVKQTGIDVFILLDVSLSMNAEDIRPNRLSKAKHSIASLIQRLRGDRIGLIVFSGNAYVQFPLTTDYAAANLLLNAVSLNSVPQPGTAIADAITTAVRSFKDDAKTQKVIVIITDGEDHEGDLNEAIKEAVEKNISIYTIGLGSPSGVPIPVSAGMGQNPYKTDSYGNIVLTRLDEPTLQLIAGQGNGRYYRGSNTENELDQIYSELSKLEKTEFGTVKITDYEDRFYLLLIPALLLLIGEFFISEKKSPVISNLFRKLGIH